MKKKKSVVSKLAKNPRNVSLKDFERLIKAYGYIEEGGKHLKAIIGDFTMPYKRENPVKSCYVRELVSIIDSLK